MLLFFIIIILLLLAWHLYNHVKFHFTSLFTYINNHVLFKLRYWYHSDEHLQCYINKHRTLYHLDTVTCRNTFNDMHTFSRPLAKNHTHPESANNRNYATYVADRFAALLGLETFYLQQSRADTRLGRNGNRTWYWVKDLMVELSLNTIDDTSLQVIIDTDYYLDMTRLLTQTFQPTVIYTIEPTAAARITTEFRYTFDEGGRIRYDVNGGASFTHHLWSYSGDSLKVYDYETGILCTYLIDKRAVDSDHVIVLLTPISKFVGFAAYVANRMLSGNNLSRFNPVKDGYIRFDVVGERMLRTLALPNTYNCATILVDLDDSIATAARLYKTDISIPQIMSYDIERGPATILCEYHRAITGKRPITVFPVLKSVNHYQYTAHAFSPETKVSVQPFMNPIVGNGCFAPLNCPNNTFTAVSSRVTELQKVLPKLEDKYVNYMLEFLTLSFPKQSLDPVDYDEVEARLKRPNQKAEYLSGQYFSQVKHIAKSFMKKESYGEPKEPRIITTFPNADKSMYARFIHAVNDLIIEKEWYAFGKTPREIAERVTHICQSANYVCNTDFSRWDGRVCNVIRDLEQIALVYLFKRKYHTTVVDCHRKHYNITSFTNDDLQYNIAFTKGSGGMDTAAFNSMMNAFIAYAHFRESRIDGNEISAARAYNMLGIYGGDDGLTANYNPDVYVKVAETLGQKLEIVRVERGKPGVEFLARLYSPEVWFGSPDSMCDITRQLSKLHVTAITATKIKPEDKFLEKMLSFATSDYNTPVFDKIYTRLEQLGVNLVPSAYHEELKPFRWYIDTKENQYPNTKGIWMYDVLYQQLPGFDISILETHLNRATELLEVMAFPICVALDSKIKHNVVVNNIVTQNTLPVSKLPNIVGSKQVQPAEAPIRTLEEINASIAGKMEATEIKGKALFDSIVRTVQPSNNTISPSSSAKNNDMKNNSVRILSVATQPTAGQLSRAQRRRDYYAKHKQ